MGEREPLSLVLFSGTDDRLDSATMLIAGAAASGRSVHVLLQYWALEAFRRDSIRKDHGISAEAGPEGAAMLGRWQEQNPVHWSDTLRQVKAMGRVRILACSMSMDLFHLAPGDLDPMVDGVEGIASFWAGADGGSVMFV